jgi:hypothetical protein
MTDKDTSPARLMAPQTSRRTFDVGGDTLTYIPHPQVTVEATYAATDGLVPETVSVRWDLTRVQAGPTASEIAAAIDALARVPHLRHVDAP